MLPAKRLALLILLSIVTSLVILTTVQCVTEEKSSEKVPDETYEDAFEYDDDEGEEEVFQEVYGSQPSYEPVPLPIYPGNPAPNYRPMPPPMIYQSVAEPQINYYQPPSYASPNYSYPNNYSYSPMPTYQLIYPEQPVYSVPPPSYNDAQPIYAQPSLNYSAPQQTHSVQNYSAPQPSHQAPQQTYQAPQQSYQVPQPTYQAAQQTYAQPGPDYSAPQQTYSTQNYSASQPTYQTPQQTYQVPQPTYQAAQPTYQAPQPTYQAAQQTYAQPSQNYSVPQTTHPTQNYSAPQPTYQTPQQTYQVPQPTYQAAQQTYQQPKQPSYSAQKNTPPSYAPAPVVKSAPVSYSTPRQAGAVATNYQAKSNYTTSPVVHAQQKPAQYNAHPPAHQQQSFKYNPNELVPFLPVSGYQSNHWSSFYYRSAPYRNCPKNVYLNGPAYKDLESAFAYAQAQLGQYRGSNVTYMDASHPSFAARHQIFHYLGRDAARMDEEGLLVELVSQYLAERLCMTKWDKQRYLPQLTKAISVSQFPAKHSCSNHYQQAHQVGGVMKQCVNSRYRTYDGFCNNPYHPYWGKSNVCHIRLLSPDYADGISLPRNSYNPRFPLPNPRVISNYIHNDVPIDGPYNLMKMQWGQFINHDITNTALSSYDGLVDCCKQPQTRGCWPIYVPPGDKFYGPLNVTCLNFIRSGVCPTCQLGPRQQTNKNTAFLDASHVYGNNVEQANQLRTFHGGLLKTSSGKNGEVMLPVASSQEQCSGVCYTAGDSRVNQHPALTALHVLLLRNHNRHATALAARHSNWNDETLYQEARRLNIAEYQMITYNEYLPIVFGPALSAYFKLIPQHGGYTYYEPKVDPTTWNEYVTASCRFGHSQIQSLFGLFSSVIGYGQQQPMEKTYKLREWYMRPSLLNDGLLVPMVNGLLSRPAQVVDPWVTNDVRNHLYRSVKEHSGGDLAATNIWRGRDHGIPGYVHYLEYCFNFKATQWKDLALFIPNTSLNQIRKLYKVVENIDLFTGGMAERHFPGADIGPTFACINGVQYYHLKFGDRYYFEHGSQAGSFSPVQLDELRRTTLARLLCRTAHLPSAPQYAFLQPNSFNPLVNCTTVGDLDYSKF